MPVSKLSGHVILSESEGSYASLKILRQLRFLSMTKTMSSATIDEGFYAVTVPCAIRERVVLSPLAPYTEQPA
jgi:hypothetical protein